jgi:uncharacterized membrane protein YczE
MSKGLRAVFVIISCLTFGMSISFYLLAGCGPDPFTVLAEGLSKIISTTVGMANWALSLGIVSTVFLIKRKLIGWATLLSLVVISPSLDLFINLFRHIVTPESPTLIRLAFLVAGFLLLSFSIALYLSMNLGIAVVDLIPILVSTQTKIQYRWIKIIFDVVVVTIGFSLGGTFSYGTILAALGTGPLAHMMRQGLEKSR